MTKFLDIITKLVFTAFVLYISYLFLAALIALIGLEPGVGFKIIRSITAGVVFYVMMCGLEKVWFK